MLDAQNQEPSRRHQRSEHQQPIREAARRVLDQADHLPPAERVSCELDPTASATCLPASHAPAPPANAAQASPSSCIGGDCVALAGGWWLSLGRRGLVGLVAIAAIVVAI